MMPLKALTAIVLMVAAGSVLAERGALPDVEVNVPPEVFSTSRDTHTTQPCMQCCVYANQQYSQGAVINAQGVLLQCQREEHVIGTNPLIWRRVKP